MKGAKYDEKLGLLIIVFLLSACNLNPVNDSLNPQADFWLRIGGEVDRILTSRAIAPAVAVDPSGQPVVAWQESPTTSYDIYVKRWSKNFNRWESLGSKLDNSSLQNAIEPDIAVDQLGNPVVVWSEFAGSSYNIFVKRWASGCCSGSWQKVGDVVDNVPSALADQPAIAVSGNGSPFVVWRESNKVYVKYWDGLAWISLGQVNASTLPVSLPDISLDANDMPVVSWLEKGIDNQSDAYVGKWNGSSWKILPVSHDSVQDVTELSLTLDLNGRPVLAMVLDGDLVTKRLQGGVWQALGSALDTGIANNVFSPSISADQTGKIHVAWSELEGSNYNVYAKSWNGAWQSLGTTLDTSTTKKALLPALVSNASGHIFVSWQEYGGSLNQEDIRVSGWKTKSWQPLGDMLDVFKIDQIRMISMDINKLGNPVVAWIEAYNNRIDLYVKQWNGKTWIQLGKKVNTTINVSSPVIKINQFGHIYLAYIENSKLFVKKWQSRTWQVIGTPFASVRLEMDLGFTTGGLPVVAYLNDDQLFIQRWNGTNWIGWGDQVNKDGIFYDVSLKLGLSSSNQPFVLYMQGNGDTLTVKKLNGSTWETLGNILIETPNSFDSRFDMLIDNEDRPVIAFQNYGSNNYSVYVKRWDGTSWISLGAALDVSVWRKAYFPSLDMDHSGNPVVAWKENIPNDFDETSIVFVKRWNGSHWTLVGDDIRKTTNSSVQSIVVGINANNEPVVAWDDFSNFYVSSY